jgi:membrane protein involved in colicin uptake
VLDRFSQLTSLEIIQKFLEPYDRLKTQEHNLLAVLQALKIDFDGLAMAKKAEIAAKRKAAAAVKAAEKRAHKDAERAAQELTADKMGADGDVDDEDNVFAQADEVEGSLDAPPQR